MGLSRRTYTKEFKLAAVRRLEEGVSNRRVSGQGLQPETASLRTRLPAAGRVRS